MPEQLDIIDSLSGAIVLIDADKKMISLNRKAAVEDIGGGQY